MHALFLIKIYNIDNNFFYHNLELIYILNHLILRHYMILLFFTFFTNSSIFIEFDLFRNIMSFLENLAVSSI